MFWRVGVAAAALVALQTFSSRTLGVRVDVLVMEGHRTAAAGLPAGARLASKVRLGDVPQALASGRDWDALYKLAIERQ